jgi:undecaprenyl-diphosphatase
MDWIQSLFLGIIQGLTEFLPVSSSGHLVLGQHLMNISIPGHIFEVMVHLGTLGSVLVVFRRDIIEILTTLKSKQTQNDVWILMLGTLPAICAGFLLKDKVNIIFEDSSYVGIALMTTGSVLILSKRFYGGHSELTLLSGLIIGLSQAIAILPGISRSGMTICTGLILGISSEKAARFSFLLSIPVIFGAGLLTALEIESFTAVSWIVMICGFFSSFFIGIFALKWLLNWLKLGRFFWFGFYCLITGFVTWIIT